MMEVHLIKKVSSYIVKSKEIENTYYRVYLRKQKSFLKSCVLQHQLNAANKRVKKG